VINETIANSTADVLESDKNYIMAEWLSSVRGEIGASKNKTDAQITDQLGSFFNNLIHALRTMHPNQMMKDNWKISKDHGLQRSGLADYSLEQIIEEYHLLRDHIFNYLVYEAHMIPSEEDRSIIHSFVDNAIQVAASEFINQSSSKKNKRDESLRTLSIINRVGQTLTSKLDMEQIIQSVTSAAMEITEAESGAFFYSGRDEKGKKLLFFTLSGLAKEMCDNPPCAKVTEVFHPTFVGLGTIRSDDITKDTRFEKNLPYYGLPEDESDIKSYLGVSVISKSGDVLGGLFLGHRKAGMFTDQDQQIVEGLAAQAAIAMENGKLYQKVQSSLKDRDTFLSIASHELKTPLTSLTLQAQMRKRQLRKGNMDAFDKGKLEAMFEADVKQLAGLNRLIDDMLDISRIRTGRLELNKEYFDLSKLAKEVVERFRPQLEEACGKFVFDSKDAIFIEADPYRIEQVIANLLTNAMKYGKGNPLDIRVFADNEHARGFLRVTDNGMGISEEDQERIFARFERAVSPDEVSGLGLGLAIVKDIVEAHGGQIYLESEVGVGSNFTIAFKIVQKH
jgi:signal transduction histidine kinase